MAAVATVKQSYSLGLTKKLYELRIALDNSYPTNGEVIDVPGNERLDTVMAGAYKGYTFEWDDANQKLKVYRGDNANAGAAPGVEVANAVDLSALTAIPALAIGS